MQDGNVDLKKIAEKQKELKEANKRFKKTVEEIIKQLKKVKWWKMIIEKFIFAFGFLYFPLSLF